MSHHQRGYPEQPPSYMEATSGGSAFQPAPAGGYGGPGTAGGSGGAFQQQPPPGYGPGYGAGSVVHPGYGAPPQSASAPPPPPPPPHQQQQQQQQYQQQQQQHHQPDEELSVWFYAVDEDGNGHITADELRQALLDEDCKPFSLTTCRMLVRMFDDNSNGEIELDEFVQLYHYVRKWREIFLRHDADFSGTIELEELNQSVNTVHHPRRFNSHFCGQLMRRFGRRQRGSTDYCLSLDNFIALNARMSKLVKEYTGNPTELEKFLLSRLRDDS